MYNCEDYDGDDYTLTRDCCNTPGGILMWIPSVIKYTKFGG